MELFLIDTLSPFFAPLEKNREYNWSKVPFTFLEDNNGIKPEYRDIILSSLKKYIKRIKDIGYNAVTVDELCRMVYYHFYPTELIYKIKNYREFYRTLFKIIKDEGLQIFITTDIMFYNQHIDAFLENNRKRKATNKLLLIAIEMLFTSFSEVDGVIFRLGESDGVDVKGDFISKLFIKTPGECRNLIKKLIPIFENKNKKIIVRSWTLGAYSIGDLMWNKNTVNRVFRGIRSDNLIISHKYGESDFFRYLDINPLFFNGRINKIVELQSKREYEGFGEFPCYIGSDYEDVCSTLKNAKNIVGLSTWCQTGGWSHFNRLTYGRDSSLWTEINTYIIPKIFKDGVTAKEAVKDYSAKFFPQDRDDNLYKLLKLSEKVFWELWYIPEISSLNLYFRRSRIPPLLWIVWDDIIISYTLRRVLKSLVKERKAAICDGYRALNRIHKIREYGEKLGIDCEQFDFMYDTFNIIAHGREYYLGKFNYDIQKKIEKLTKEYKEKYPAGFHINTDFNLVHPRKWLIKTIFKIAIRTKPEYTLFERIFLIKASSLIYRLVNRINRSRKNDELLNKKAMGIQVFFK